MTDIEKIGLASNIANVIVAAMNVALVIFLYWQIKIQKSFILDSAKREATSKVAEAYQRFCGDVIRSPRFVSIMYQDSPNHELSTDISMYFYYLNVLNLEFTYHQSGLLHANSIPRGIEYFSSCFKSKDTLTAFMALVEKAGFHPEFESLVLTALRRRLAAFS
jgi:hypothetical protein